LKAITPSKITLEASKTAPAIDSEKKFSITQVFTEPVKFIFKTVIGTGKGILRLAGAVIGATLELPVVKQVWTGTRILSGVIFGIPSGDFFDKSLSIKFDKMGPAVISINGMWTSGKKARDIHDAVREYFGVKDATMIRNRSHWVIGDIFQILGHELIGAIDKPALNTAKAIRVGIQEKGEVYVVAHSQGSAIFKQSLSLLSADERSKIHYIGLGPQWIIDSAAEGLASAKNIWNKGDFVPTLGNRLRVVSNFLFPWNWGRLSERDLVQGSWSPEPDRNATPVAPETENDKGPHSFENYKRDLHDWVIKRRQQWAYGNY